ncbi:hypothetical protein [Bacteroides sp. 519]|uniref:hypothetical protein n=1 Tax=Bacteroides sp. 519 TaxID=2302937 RepID=UPI0013D4D6CA|nr:hypothetical protein [Bacteroides sp. 519]
MKASIQPIQEKNKSEKEAIESKLSKLLKTFRTKDLSLDEINEEVEKVRQQIYQKR